MGIRSAQVQDLTHIHKLVVSLSKFYLIDGGGELPLWLQKTLVIEKFKQRMLTDNFIHLLYEQKSEQGNEIVGYLSIKNKCHLYHLFVREDCQGRGISKKLWQEAMRLCQSSFYTVRSSIYAVPIYKHYGFVPIGDSAEREGVGYQKMELVL